MIEEGKLICIDDIKLLKNQLISEVHRKLVKARARELHIHLNTLGEKTSCIIRKSISQEESKDKYNANPTRQQNLLKCWIKNEPDCFWYPKEQDFTISRELKMWKMSGETELINQPDPQRLFPRWMPVCANICLENKWIFRNYDAGGKLYFTSLGLGIPRVGGMLRLIEKRRDDNDSLHARVDFLNRSGLEIGKKSYDKFRKFKS